MAYSEPVTFTATDRYGCGPDDQDDVYMVAEFAACVETGALIDYDGFGHPVKGGKCDPSIIVKPLRLDEIPADATHVVWYNR